MEVAAGGKTISEDELIKILDKIPNFWEMAELQKAVEIIRHRKKKNLEQKTFRAKNSP